MDASTRFRTCLPLALSFFGDAAAGATETPKPAAALMAAALVVILFVDFEGGVLFVDFEGGEFSLFSDGVSASCWRLIRNWSSP